MTHSTSAVSRSSHAAAGSERRDAVGYHDYLADGWEAKYGASSSFASRDRAFRASLASFVQPGSYWLDAGCGTGHFSRMLCELGARVEGVDASHAMLEQAARLSRHSATGHDVPRFTQIADLSSLPFSDYTFDGCICSSVLEYVAAPALCLEELHRVLRPRAALLISVPNAQSWSRMLQNLTFRVTSRYSAEPRPAFLRHSKHQYDAAAFAALLERTGFDPDAHRFFAGPPRFMEASRYSGSLMLFTARRRA